MKEKLYSGSSKSLYIAEEESVILMSFEDTVKNSKGEIIEISGKGSINNSISALIMNKLSMVGISNHFIKKHNMKQQSIQLVEMLPLQVNICTLACGNYVKKYGLEEGFVFESPILEFLVKSSELKYPTINESQIINFGWMLAEEIDELKKLATRVHDFVSGLFAGVGLRLVECRLEFGKVFDGEDIILMLADEISPDNCRLWDINTNEKYCFELIDENPKEAGKKYQEVLARLRAFDN